MNSIKELLDLEDADIAISDISVSGTVKTIILETHPRIRFLSYLRFQNAFQRNQDPHDQSSGPTGFL